MTLPKQVAVLGLGAMGAAIAERLVDKGFCVSGFDLDPDRTFSRGRRARTARDAVEAADVVLVAVATANQVVEVVVGETGLFPALRDGAVLAVISTIGQAAMTELASAPQLSGTRLLDAPMTGGPGRARTGHLVAMIGGDSVTLEAAQPVLTALATSVVHCGDIGAGQAMKLVNQLLAGVHLVAAAEALEFARAIGVEPKLAYEVVSRGAGTSFMLEDRVPRMLAADFFPATTALDIFAKDMSLVVESARSARFEAPLASAAASAFDDARRNGAGRLDDSAVIETYRAG